MTCARLRFTFVPFFTLFVLVTANVISYAQGIGATVNAETATPIPGAGHDYIHLLSETVDPSSGQISLHISPPMPKGRGLTIPFSITYNSAGVHRLEASTWGGGWTHESFSGGFPYGQGGWGYSWMPLLSASTWETTQGEQTSLIYCDYFSNYTFTDVSGTGHNLLLGWVTAHGPGVNNQWIVGGTCGSTNAQAGDSQVTAFLKGGGYNSSPEDTFVLDTEGTFYMFGGSGSSTGSPPEYIEDRNGNIISNIKTPNNGYPLGYTDTLGRPVVSVTGTGAAGTQDTVIVGGLTYKVLWTTVSASYATQQNLVPPTSQTTSCPPTIGSVSDTQTVISAILLPNGQEYSFSYDSTGLLSQITYPDGGWVQYSWTTSPQTTGSPYSEMAFFTGVGNGGFKVQQGCEYQYTPPQVSERRVSFDGSSVALIQDFSPTTSWVLNAGNQYWNEKTNSVTTTDSISGLSYKKVYDYYPFPGGSQPYATVSVASEFPMEHSVTTYDWGSTSILDVETKGWLDQYELACEVHDSIGDGTHFTRMSGHFYKYQYGQISDDQAFEPSSTNLADACTKSTPPSSPTRETITSYSGFTSVTASSWGSTMYFGRPTTVKTYGGTTEVAETDYGYDETALTDPTSGTIVNQDSYYYPTGIVKGRGNVTTVRRKCLYGCSQDAVTTAAYDVAGQVASVTDPCGNSGCSDMVGTTTQTVYSFADNFQSGSGTPPSGKSTDAYLTKVTSPSVCGIAQLHEYQYRYSDGQLTQAQGSNDLNQVPAVSTAYVYSDSLNRLTKTSFPDGGMALANYPDPSAISCKLVNGTAGGGNCGVSGAPSGTWMSTTSKSDGMGKITETDLTSDPDGTVTTTTKYYGTGLVYQQSNPNRGTSTGTTTFYYDALGRKVKQVDSDGTSTQWWCYNGVRSSSVNQPTWNCNAKLGSQPASSWVDYGDENGNDWQRASDSFGDLLDVMEPNGVSKTPSMETVYQYNALSNLLSVTQKGISGTDTARTRTFSYDSFSRLTQSYNPETGWVCYGTTGGQAATSSNCSPQYDTNGNLSMKTDARGVTTQYLYDLLNRLTSKSYLNDLSATPKSCYQYDKSSLAGSNPNLIGNLANQWTLRASGGGCAAACSAPASPYLTLRSITSYDLMNRPKTETQCTPSNCTGTAYALTYGYDQGGDATSYTTGFGGPTLTQAFSGAGHLQTINSTLTGPTYPTVVFSATPNTVGACSTDAYAPWGSLQNAAFGNGVTLSRGYDSRLRISCETDKGTIGSSNTSGSTTLTITGMEQSK